MYEKRAIYFTELDKLGAETVLADPHRIFIHGPSTLHPNELVCPDGPPSYYYPLLYRGQLEPLLSLHAEW